eukprot:5464712-Amphidinium_carterae.1
MAHGGPTHNPQVAVDLNAIRVWRGPIRKTHGQWFSADEANLKTKWDSAQAPLWLPNARNYETLQDGVTLRIIVPTASMAQGTQRVWTSGDCSSSTTLCALAWAPASAPHCRRCDVGYVAGTGEHVASAARSPAVACRASCCGESSGFES